MGLVQLSKQRFFHQKKEFYVKMSWLFGLDKNQQGLQGFEAPQVPTLGQSGQDYGQDESGQASGSAGTGGGGGSNPGGSIGSDAEGYRSASYSFDSTALERAAKAAKDLEKSKHASEALALSRVQEETKQKEQEVRVKEYEMQIENMKIEQKRVEGTKYKHSHQEKTERKVEKSVDLKSIRKLCYHFLFFF